MNSIKIRSFKELGKQKFFNSLLFITLILNPLFVFDLNLLTITFLAIMIFLILFIDIRLINKIIAAVFLSLSYFFMLIKIYQPKEFGIFGLIYVAIFYFIAIIIFSVIDKFKNKKLSIYTLLIFFVTFLIFDVYEAVYLYAKIFYRH